MTKYQKGLTEVSNEELVDRFDGTVTNACRDMDRYCRITKATSKALEDLRAEMLRRMER